MQRVQSTNPRDSNIFGSSRATLAKVNTGLGDNTLVDYSKKNPNAMVTTRRAALGDISNQVANKTNAASTGLGLKKGVDVDKKISSNAVTKVEARRPLRSNSLALNSKPTVSNSTNVAGVSCKPPLKLLKDEKSTLPAVARKPPLANAGSKVVVQAQIHNQYRNPMGVTTTAPFAERQNFPKVQRPNNAGALKSSSFGANDKKKVTTIRSSSITLKQQVVKQHATIASNDSIIEIDIVEKEQIVREEMVSISNGTAPINEPITEDSDPLKSSDAYSTAMIPDIDASDQYFPQLVSEFASDIYDYLRQLERVQFVKSDFLAGREITSRMRGILIDWLAQVHMRFHLLPETMYMTVMLIDRYLQDRVVQKDQLQLLGVAAMFLASKYEEIYAPEIGDFVYITDNTYTKEQVRQMERLILRALHFDLGRPLAIHFLRRYSKAAESDDDMHTMAKYFLELTFVDYDLASKPPSLVAAAAMWLTLKLIGDGKWSPTLVHYTKYPENDVMPIVRTLCQLIVNVYDRNSKYQFIRNKFASKKFREIAEHSTIRSPVIRQLASTHSNPS